MSVRANLAWIRHGSVRTEATIATHAAAIGALQEQVQSLANTFAEFRAEIAGLRADLIRIEAKGAEPTEAVAAMRIQLRTITDDLGDRVGSISARLESQLGV